MASGMPSAASVNRTLTALRDMATSNEREQGGYRVADIPAGERKGCSLHKTLAERYSISANSAGRHIWQLVQAGFIQAGIRGKSIPRWVRLDGTFSYDDK